MSQIEPGPGQSYLDKLGIEFVEASGERVEARMPVAGNTQPDGFLHGGATMSLVETLASYGAALAADYTKNLVVGLQQTCNFISTATEGSVRGVASKVHQGRMTAVWDVEVTAEATGKRVAMGRVTLAIRPRRTD